MRVLHLKTSKPGFWPGLLTWLLLRQDFLILEFVPVLD